MVHHFVYYEHLLIINIDSSLKVVKIKFQKNKKYNPIAAGSNDLHFHDFLGRFAIKPKAAKVMTDFLKGRPVVEKPLDLNSVTGNEPAPNTIVSPGLGTASAAGGICRLG